MKIVLLGPPGAGKGTQAEAIIKRFGIVHISTGDIFRKNIKENTPLGLKVKEYTQKGLLVPDEVTVSMVAQRLEEDDCKAGYMLDGFPRTINQAVELDKILNKAGEKLDCALVITADYAKLTERIVGRRICKGCAATYHVTFNPPQKQDVCDKCGSELYQRDDDKEATVVKRLEEYDEKTAPLIDYYEKQGIVKKVDGQQSISAVEKDIADILSAL